jgi:hypothetical protein
MQILYLLDSELFGQFCEEAESGSVSTVEALFSGRDQCGWQHAAGSSNWNSLTLSSQAFNHELQRTASRRLGCALVEVFAGLAVEAMARVIGENRKVGKGLANGVYF